AIAAWRHREAVSTVRRGYGRSASCCYGHAARSRTGGLISDFAADLGSACVRVGIMVGNCELLRRAGHVLVEKWRVRLYRDGVGSRMKGENFQPAIAAIGEILHISKNLVDQIPVVAYIFAMRDRAARKMAVQHHDHIRVLSQPLPHLLSVGITRSHVLSVASVLAQPYRS